MMEVAMYRLNQLNRKVLIMVDEVIFHAATKQTVDNKAIENAIIIAEERLIRPAIGDDFYYALLDEKNLVVTSGNKDAQQSLIDAAFENKQKPKSLEVGDIINAIEYLSDDSADLWRQHLWKLCSECVMLVAMSDSFVQTSAAGIVHTSPQSGPLTGNGAVTPDLRSVKWAMDKKMMDRIDPLFEAMHQWLCRQRDADDTIYPDYKKACDCNWKGISHKRKTNFVLGVYPANDINYLDRRDPDVHPDCWWCDD